MDDLISRQAAINVICEMHIGGKDAVKNALPNTYGADLREIIEQIDNLPSADVPNWIPCSERLPNEEEYIQSNGLFIVSDGDRAYAEYFDIYDKKCFGEHTMHGFRADMAVTKWMPLPEP